MQPYEHRQHSPWTLALTVAGFAAQSVVKNSNRRLGLLASLATSLLVAQFSVLNTRVDSNRVTFAFGLGFPSGSIELRDIASVDVTKTKWWEGWGIHWTPQHGWLWNVAGSDAVRIRKRNGAAVTIGSDDAQGLCAAINANRGVSPF